MPRLDPGYQSYLEGVKHEIEPTEFGWVWITPDGERHELFVPFCTVHVTKGKLLCPKAK